jgi:anti-sigma B factor antagonist
VIGNVQTVQIAQRQLERGVGVLEMKGSIHAGPDCVWIEQTVAALIQEGKTRVIFDLSGVSHIDSPAIASIVRCLSRLRQAQGDLRLAGACCMVEGTLKITRLDRIIGMYPTVASADFLSLDASAKLGPG